MDSNTVTPHPDYIEVVWRGAQSVDKIRASNSETLTAVNKLKANKKPLLVLLYIIDHPDFPNMEGLVEVISAIRATPLDRLAVCGDVPPTVMPLIATVIATFNRQMEVKYLKKYDDALTWLKSAEPGNRDD